MKAIVKTSVGTCVVVNDDDSIVYEPAWMHEPLYLEDFDLTPFIKEIIDIDYRITDVFYRPRTMWKGDEIYGAKINIVEYANGNIDHFLIVDGKAWRITHDV